MDWLIVAGRRVPLEIAATAFGRARGLLGRRTVDGALWLTPTRSVHTIGMRFPIDIAHLDADLAVLETFTLRPNRFGPRVRGTRSILEAEAGSFDHWGLRSGMALGVEADGRRAA